MKNTFEIYKMDEENDMRKLMVKTEMENEWFIGTINLGEKVRISDPVYDLDTWCAGSVDNALPGNYNCFLNISDEEDWGLRVKELDVIHESFGDISEEDLWYITCPFVVGVDSGMCGVYDYEFFVDTEENMKLRFDVSYGYGDVIDNSGVVCQSGFGDGYYACELAVNRGRVVGFRIQFI